VPACSQTVFDFGAQLAADALQVARGARLMFPEQTANFGESFFSRVIEFEAFAVIWSETREAMAER
jgi:hypothetical protein